MQYEYHTLHDYYTLYDQRQLVPGERFIRKRQAKIRRDIEQVPIPVLSIQPLVENAIKHGIAARTEPGRVRIKANRRGEELRISVETSGSGKPAGSVGTGVGLQNVKRRLEICYGPSSHLALSLTPDAATVALRIPLDKAIAAGSIRGQPIQKPNGA